jgi:hypothetical protein
MSVKLDFLNKNMYRKYPIRATSTHEFEDGSAFPQDVITSIQISVPYTYNKLYISKVYALNRYLSVTVNDYATDNAVGAFSAKITSKFQIIPLTPFIDQISGNLTVGSLDGIDKINGAHFLSKDNGLLEASTIFPFTPPAVTKLIHGEVEMTGHINLVTENITAAALDSVTISLSIINEALIASNNDFHGSLDNCATPLIKRINTVEPDEDGNIDIYGILPVTVEVETGEVELIPNLTLDEVCPERTKIYPPENNSDEYYTDILTATEPEWKTWPIFS